MPSIVFVRYMHSQDIDTISLQVDLHFNQWPSEIEYFI